MKNYNATYTDQTGNLISTATFEANNLKDAKYKAQLHKRQTPEIMKAKRVKTIVELSETDKKDEILKKIKRQIQAAENLQKKYGKIKDKLPEGEKKRLAEFFE
jgi:hypothetical protein